MRKVLFFLLLSFGLHALQIQNGDGELKPAAKELLALFDVPTDLSMEELVHYLQKEWLQANKERWEMDKRLEGKRETALPLFRKLECIDSIRAKENHYDYALILGATGKTMLRRLDFLYEEWQRGVRFDRIILLSGARDLNPKLESYPEGLKTETDLLIHLFNDHPLYGLVPHLVVDSPKHLLRDGTLRRPTTAATICDWLLLHPTPGSCLSVSTQPFIGYQEAVVKYILPDQFEVEGIGSGTENRYPTANLDLETPSIPYPLAIYLDNFAKWLMYEFLKEHPNEKYSSKHLSYPTWGN